MRYGTMTRVLPVPAPARIKTGPLMISTASRCGGFSEPKFDMGARSLVSEPRNASAPSIFNHMRPARVPLLKEFSISPQPDLQVSSRQSARASNATSDARWPPSCAVLDGSCPRSIPNQPSNQERSSEIGLADCAAALLAAAPKSARDRARFSGLESKFRAPVF